MPTEAMYLANHSVVNTHRTTHVLTNNERGYDSSWSKGVRPFYISQHPVCERCRAMPSSQVHHIVSFRGRKDPRRLDLDNLTALCDECHQAAHGSHAGKVNVTLQSIEWDRRMSEKEAFINSRYNGVV